MVDHKWYLTPEYSSYQAMKQRVLNPNAPNYKHYGGRGIQICDRWLESFENFYADMGRRPEGTTLDRFPDIDGHYEPSNCRWATDEEQQNHKQYNHTLEYKGITMTLALWAREIGLSESCIRNRLDRGWSVEETLSTPAESLHTEGRLITYNGKTQNLSRWAEETSISSEAISTRLDRGWSVERALTEPLHTNGQKRHVTYKRETLILSEWSRRIGVPFARLQQRLNLGWTVEEAFETPIGELRPGTIGKAHGDSHVCAKLTSEKALEIYKRAWDGESQNALAREFGIKPSTVSTIKNGRSWNHVTNHRK